MSEINNKTGFFEEAPGVFSMSRMAMFINLLVAAWVTITGVPPIADKAPGYDFVTLILMLWVLAYGGKNAAKYIENIKK